MGFSVSDKSRGITDSPWNSWCGKGLKRYDKTCGTCFGWQGYNCNVLLRGDSVVWFVFHLQFWKMGAFCSPVIITGF